MAILQAILFFSCRLRSSYQAVLSSILRNKTNGTWIFLAANFASVEGAKEFILRFMLVT